MADDIKQDSTEQQKIGREAPHPYSLDVSDPIREAFEQASPDPDLADEIRIRRAMLSDLLQDHQGNFNQILKLGKLIAQLSTAQSRATANDNMQDGILQLYDQQLRADEAEVERRKQEEPRGTA